MNVFAYYTADTIWKICLRKSPSYSLKSRNYNRVIIEFRKQRDLKGELVCPFEVDESRPSILSQDGQMHTSNIL